MKTISGNIWNALRSGKSRKSDDAAPKGSLDMHLAPGHEHADIDERHDGYYTGGPETIAPAYASGSTEPDIQYCRS